jgi:hypothetical protein
MKKKLYQLLRILTGKKAPSFEEETHNNEILKEKVTYKEVKTKYDSIVFFCKNNNNVPVDIDIKNQITTQNKKKHYIDHTSLISVAPGKEAVAEIYMCCVPNKYDSSYVSMDVSESIEKCHNNEIKITHKNTGKNIQVKVKNNSKENLDTLNFVVIYYDKKEIIDTYHYEEKYLKSEEDISLEITYPTNEEEQEVSFDKYKIILNQASRVDWFN